MAALGAAAFAAVAVGDLRAQGATEPSCEYVRRGAPGPRGNVLVIEQPTLVAVKVRRAGSRIAVLRTRRPYPPRPIACSGGNPTVRNVDRIRVLAARINKVQLDLRSGPLAPGASERGQGAEIEVRLGRLGPDASVPRLRVRIASGGRPNKIELGRSGSSDAINLNPNQERHRDPDVFLGPWDPFGSWITILPGGGSDRVTALGGSTFPGPIPDLSITVEGGSGRDRLTGGLAGFSNLIGDQGSDRLVGAAGGGSLYGGQRDDVLIGRAGSDGIRPGGGEDLIRGNGGTDLVGAADGRRDRIDCGPGDDRAVVDQLDRVADCERVFLR
jgi:hypothetical protein